MRLRKSSKWLLLLALVAFASVLHDFPSADAAKSKGKKKGETSSIHQSSSRHKYSRTKGKKYSSNSSSSSASASVELGDKVSGVNVNGSGGGGGVTSSSMKQGSSATQYSKVFKKGPLKSSSSSSNSSGSGSYHVSKKGSSSSKSKSKSSSKLTIITPSPVTTTSTTTTPEPLTVRTTPITERLTTTRRITSPKTGKTRTKLSFGLGHESGIHSSSWVGIGANGAGISVGDLGGLSSSASTYFAGGNKEYHPLERGGLYADGLDLDFAKVYPEEVTELPMVTTNTNGFSPVGVGTINHDQPTHNYETLMMTGRVDELEKKVMELERTIATMQKNIEVLQQNTQVISKGFNILSGRVNKVTGDYELVNGKLEDYRKTFDEKIIATEQNVSLALIALKLQTTSEIEEIKKASLEAIGNATATNTTEARHPVDNSELCDKYIQNITLKMEDWQRTAANETKLVAEMVKALAEISQGEKLKLENLSNYSRRELEKLGDILEKQGVEHSHEWDAITTKVKALRMEVEERDKKFTSDILDVHAYLRNTSKHCEEEVKKVEESLLEQNMAHNMAHENIALKIDEMTTALEQKPSMDPSYLRRLSGAEANITTLFAANKQFLQQFSAVEEMNGLILSKITDLRTVHKNDNATTKKEVFEVQRSVSKLEHDSRVILDRVRDLQSKVDQSRDLQMDIGRLGDIEVETPKPTEVSIALQVEIGEMKDRIVTFEENVAELWRSHKQITDMLQHNGDMVNALQTAHLADHEDVSLQIMEIKIASKLLSEVIRNLSKNMSDFESRVESSNTPSEYSIGYSNFSSRLGEAAPAAPPEKLETGSLNIDCRAMEDDINNLWELSRNISKAQELFLVKLLEMDMEHERDNKTVRQMLMFVMNRTEDFSMQFLTADERINKILQQFEFTDAEQAKMREELLNIKDRLASAEENYNALWKASRHLEKGQDEIQNSVDNIVLVHKTEAKNLSSDMSSSKQKLDNISTALAGLNDRVSNLELFSDMDSSRESSQLNSTELGKIKARLASAERDIQELWKSSEILSFQQQVFNEKVRDVQTVHENDTMSASIERMRNQLETQNLHLVVGNMTSRLQTVEKYTSPPYESKTIEFEINNWNEALADGLKNQQVVYEIGSLLDLPSSWRTFVERSGNYISLYNSLVKSEKPVYNEFTVEILDSDGRVYSTYGPDMHLYKTNEKIGWSSMISMSALQNPTNRLVTNNALRFRLRTKLYPNGKAEEETPGPSEKQRILWEISDVASKLKREIDEDQAFVDLHISKEFVAGHYWGGNTRWKSSLLMREIHHQNYLGINMELLHVDQNWRELVASYNVTLLDAHDRIVKEFSIASNDFKAVSARHSYFMLVKDVLEVLERGDKLTIKIFFDLQARKRSFDVEFIRT